MNSVNDSVQDRSLRSILIGNVPSDVSEDIVKELLTEYGVILNFRWFRDIPPGYAFCEYGEPEMAIQAVQNLNDFEFKGRVLKADIAASEKSKEQLARLQEFSNGVHSDILQAADSSEKAPEEISKAVASLPAEQMFELMKQMKMCIENNPQEARNLLLQNPQLAYALLQAQVIMRIVDPEVAVKILNRPTIPLASVEPEVESMETVEQTLPPVNNPIEISTAGDQDLRQLPPLDSDMRTLSLGATDKDMRQMTGDTDWRTLGAPLGLPDPRFRTVNPRVSQSCDPRGIQGPDPRHVQGPLDPRSVMMQGPDPRLIQNSDPRMLQGTDPRSVHSDPRSVPAGDPRVMQGGDSRVMSVDPRVPVADPRSVDPRVASNLRGMPSADPRAMRGADSRTAPVSDSRIITGPGFGPRPGINDPRNVPVASRVEDPRKFPTSGVPVSAQMSANTRTPTVSSAPTGLIPTPRLPVPPAAATTSKVPEDQEKAALIMQVLQLSDEQIAMLPPEQRQSIIVLKEQLARSQLAL
ncbi:cleavage stimulation factor subunit 2-like [Argiope bruennichi]|uniref:Cleavage stimulation factor subunit 2 like protein n=1 Tax=Argiope bruennichi TaxID=94029 RepID=A0A8T0E1D0_ARGBR|nr:cleavage stimulation factor subunit 2-like [Argiope bruennichi]KAF8764263.1 Cleavage stimulation factor subunit 2 like protein [Argiope bruennichi]